MKKLQDVTFEQAAALLEYHPTTGRFTWRIRVANIRAGSPAGHRSKTYVTIRLLGKSYVAQRLAWLLQTGEWPASDIDHRDRDKHNNAWSNLRLATPSQNRANCGVRKHSRSGVKGVHLYRGRYVATVTIAGRPVYIGTFDTIEAAASAYQARHRDLHAEFSPFHPDALRVRLEGVVA